MTDEMPGTDPSPDAASEPTPGSEPTPAAASATAEAWNDVVGRMTELGGALSHWARAAADDPQNKQRLEQVRASVDEMARQADAALGKVTSSDFGQQVSQGAQQAGDAIGGAAQQVSEAAAPHVATALSGLASVFGRAAAKVDEAANRDRAAGGTASDEAAPTAPHEGPPPASPPNAEDQA